MLLWFRRRVIDGVLDGIVYAGLVEVGFAFTENILYLTPRTWAVTAAPARQPRLGDRPGPLAFAASSAVRAPLFTAFIGLGVGFAVVAKKQSWRFSPP